MSGSLGDFIIGGIAIGLGFVATIVPGAQFLAGPLYAYGIGRIAAGMTKLFFSEEQRIQGSKINVRSTQASIPVIYGRSRVGLKTSDMRVLNATDPDTPNANPAAIFATGGGEDQDEPADDDDVLVKVGAVALGSSDGSGIQDIDQVRVYSDGVDVIPTPGAFSAAPVNTGVIPRYQNVLKYILEDGDDAQTPRTELLDQLGWGEVGVGPFNGQGVAYAAFFTLFRPELWSQGVPQYTMRVTGSRVYDPRSSTFIDFATSGPSADNPALCVLDYLTSLRYGGGVPYAARDGGTEDFIDEQSFIDSANYCDDLVSIQPSGTEKRFRMNAVIDTGVVVGRNLAEMLITCRGELIWQNGLYRLVIRQVTTPEIFELTEDNIVGSIGWTRRGASVPNYIEAVFPDSQDGHFNANTVSWPLVGDTTFLDEDNGVENRFEVALPYTTTFLQAQRTIMVLLREARNDVLANLTCTQAAYTLQVGAVVRVTHEGPGWDQLEFIVRQVSLTPDGLVALSLQQYTVVAYDLDTLAAQPSAPTTNLPNPNAIDAPTGFTLTSGPSTTLLTQDGQAVPRIQLDWTAPVDPYLSHFDVRFRKTADPDFEAAPDPKKFDTMLFIWPVSDQVEYTVEIRSVNAIGVTSAFVSDTVLVNTSGQPQFTMQAFLDVSQAAVVSVTGNAAVRSVRVAFVKGFSPLTEPTDAEVRARTSVNGTIFSETDINAGYVDIPVALQEGEGCLFKAFAYAGLNATGTESTLPVTAFVTRLANLVFLQLVGNDYFIVEGSGNQTATIVNDLSEGHRVIVDAIVAGGALGVDSFTDDIKILAAPDVP